VHIRSKEEADFVNASARDGVARIVEEWVVNESR
jgi:hypothetical protein